MNANEREDFRRNREIRVVGTPEDVAREAARDLVGISAESIAQRGAFRVGLAGGKTPERLYSLLATEPLESKIDWSNTYLYWGDERCVPPEHPDSNYRMARESLISKIEIPAENIFRMKGEAPDPEQAAQEYERVLKDSFGAASSSEPRFDLILLGLGPDGHTASLFPGTGGG